MRTPFTAFARSSWALAVVTAFLAGCASSPKVVHTPASETAHGVDDSGAWKRFQTEHFDVMTDLATADAAFTAASLERTREALLGAAWSKLPRTHHTARVHVIVLAHRNAFEHFFGPHLDGLHTDAADQAGGETMILWGRAYTRAERHFALAQGDTRSVLRHELTHHLVAGIYLTQPRWFQEGLAQFMEPLLVSDDGTKAILGRPKMEARKAYLDVRSVGVKDALAWGKLLVSQSHVEQVGLYGLSWLMVHWMYNTQPDAFAAYQKALARGESADRAWTESFGTWKLEDMDRALHDYATHGTFQETTVDIPTTQVSVSSVPLSQADVFAVWGRLSLIRAEMDDARGGRFDRDVQRAITKALALEPGNVAALELSLASPRPMSKTEMVSRLREQTRQNVRDGEAWHLFGLLVDGAERETALRNAVDLLPDDPIARKDLAVLLVTTGRAEAALPLATTAARLAPWNPQVLATHAACLFALGRCKEALDVQTRAVDNLPERKRDTPYERPYTAAQLRYRSACDAAPTATR